MALVAALAVALLFMGDAAQGVAPGVVVVALSLGAAVLTGALEARHRGAALLAAPRLAAYSSLLSWVTVAAAGRWIGFS